MKRPSSRRRKATPRKIPTTGRRAVVGMTGAQRSYLKTLCEEAKEAFDENLTKAEASKRIDELQQKTGRGTAQNR